MSDRLIYPPIRKKRGTKIVVCCCISRIYFQSFLIMSDSLVDLTFLYEKPAQIIMRLRITRPKLNSLAIMNNHPISVALSVESDAQIVMRHPATGILCQCPRVQGDKIVVNGSLSPCQKNERQEENPTDPNKRHCN